jgi:hypothetical protein
MAFLEYLGWVGVLDVYSIAMGVLSFRGDCMVSISKHWAEATTKDNMGMTALSKLPK